MKEIANVTWSDKRLERLAAELLPAAKLHVLALTPIKEKLGPKWSRLSALVHKLFEAAIKRAQGPSDSCIRLDEMSYVVVFRNLSLDDVNRVCDCIAREVCEALFGDQIDEVSVRSVVAAIVLPPGGDMAQVAKQIETKLEERGTESVVVQSVQSPSPEPVKTIAGNVLKPLPPDKDRIAAAHSRLAERGLRVGFFPVWELQKRVSSSLLLLPFAGSADHRSAVGRQALGTSTAGEVAEIELVLLDAVAAYAKRISDSQKVCAIGVGVSYETLAAFQSRIQYLTALQKIQLKPSTPLILKIEQIPGGTPAARIGELVAMLNLPGVRPTLEFQSLRAVPKFDFRLAAAGLGGTIPHGIDHDTVLKLVKGLVDVAAAQKAFVFLDQLENIVLVEVASLHNVRFGTGVALGTRHFSGVESIPDFPLTLADSG